MSARTLLVFAKPQILRSARLAEARLPTALNQSSLNFVPWLIIYAKEKEIVDVQLELCKQENARLKTQMGHLARDLEDTRATLSDVSFSRFNRFRPMRDLIYFSL
jgi:hypothetical protein